MRTIEGLKGYTMNNEAQGLTPFLRFLRQQAINADVPERVLDATSHGFFCRCDDCKEWWRAVGPEENGTFGPFTSEEIRGHV
jgi:hypothetical protein